jgi:acyl carrier protein
MEELPRPAAGGATGQLPPRFQTDGTRKDTTPVGTDQEKARTVIGDFLQRIDKGADGWNDETALWGEGIGLDSLEAAELSAMLEDEFGSDPFSAGGDLPEKVGDVLAFYAIVST